MKIPKQKIQIGEGANSIKPIDYDYDLMSGKLNKVCYQPGKGNQFFHKYLYDAGIQSEEQEIQAVTRLKV